MQRIAVSFGALVVVALGFPALAQADSDLVMGLTDAPDPVTNGAQLTYGLSVRNDGPDPANALSVVQTLPTSVNFVSASAGCTYAATPAPPKVTCTAASLANGSTIPFAVVVTPTEPGDIVSSAVAASAQADPDAADNTAATSTHVRRSFDARVRLVALTNPVAVNSSAHFEIKLYNTGVDAMENSQVTIPIPAKAEFVSSTTCTSDGTVVTCANPDPLGSGFGGVNYDVAFRPTSTGPLTVAATVSAPFTNDQEESAPGNNTVTKTVQVRDDVIAGLCKGNTVTISGSKRSNVLRGTPGRDVIDAGKGDDIIRGRGGDDVICGGEGDDELNGGGGRDKLFGDKGDDRLNGGGGGDVCSGGGGKDRQAKCESKP